MALLTSAEVAARWSCDRTHVTKLARAGALVGMRLGTDWRFSLAAVESYETANTTGSGSSLSTEAPKTEPSRSKEVRQSVAIDGFTLPADYEPVFKDLWPFHETQKAASQRH